MEESARHLFFHAALPIGATLMMVIAVAFAGLNVADNINSIYCVWLWFYRCAFNWPGGGASWFVIEWTALSKVSLFR